MDTNTATDTLDKIFKSLGLAQIPLHTIIALLLLSVRMIRNACIIKRRLSENNKHSFLTVVYLLLSALPQVQRLSYQNFEFNRKLVRFLLLNCAPPDAVGQHLIASGDSLSERLSD